MARLRAVEGANGGRGLSMNHGGWAVQFKDLAGCEDAKDKLQTQQVERAAARLAASLRAVFPRR